MPLPSNISKRGLSRDEAAEYRGVSPNTLMRHGPPATKIGDRTIYDRRVLDRWLDQLAGLGNEPGTAAFNYPEDTLLEAIRVRKATLHNSPR